MDLSSSPRADFKLGDLTFFFRFVKPVWKIGAVSILLVIITTCISALFPLTCKVFIDFVIDKTGYGGITGLLHTLGLGAYAPAVIAHLSSLDFIIAIMIVGGLLYGLLNICQSYLSAIYQQQLMYNLQTSLFDRVLRFPLIYLKGKQTGYLVSRVADDANMMQYLFSSAVTQILAGVFYIIFGVIILLSINPGLAALIAVVIPVYLVVRYLFSSPIRVLSRQEREYNSIVSQDMQEALSGVELVKSYTTEKKEMGKVSRGLQEVVNTRVARTMLMSFASFFMSATMFVLLLTVMFMGATDIEHGTMTLGDYMTIISYIIFLSNAVNTLYGTYLTFQPALASMDRLKEMFSVAPEFEWDDKDKLLKKPDNVYGDVRFDDVSFAYNPNEPVLKHISFSVKPGEAVALVGLSGVGKTTTVSLLLKLYIPQSGAIYLDGVNLNELDYAWLRQQVSIVSQDIFLFNDTIENNIKYGKADATREEVVAVARNARIHDFIAQLPDGYDTLIGERGTKLSVGQRQRISIARAFLKNTPILILDEPTSSIDTITEQSLKESLDELMRGRTTFIVSHRMSLTDIADQVLVVDEGRIVQRGTGAELEGQEGLYRDLRALDRTHGADNAGRMPGQA
jgi:subfamily B ATP-binding cassette protein MsbA